jgi:P-type Cu2+ transporter
VTEGLAEKEALRIAAAVESESQHPIARGIVTTAQDREIEVATPDGFRSITGKGVAATVNGTEYHMAVPAFSRRKQRRRPRRRGGGG